MLERKKESELMLQLAIIETDIMIIIAKQKFTDELDEIEAYNSRLMDFQEDLMHLGNEYDACSDRSYSIIKSINRYIPEAMSLFKKGQEFSIDREEISNCPECQNNDNSPCSIHG